MNSIPTNINQELIMLRQYIRVLHDACNMAMRYGNQQTVIDTRSKLIRAVERYNHTQALSL